MIYIPVILLTAASLFGLSAPKWRLLSIITLTAIIADLMLYPFWTYVSENGLMVFGESFTSDYVYLFHGFFDVAVGLVYCGSGVRGSFRMAIIYWLAAIVNLQTHAVPGGLFDLGYLAFIAALTMSQVLVLILRDGANAKEFWRDVLSFARAHSLSSSPHH